MTRKRIGILISGRGSNLQALIDACKDRRYPAEIVLVISNVPGAYGLTRAEAAGIPALTINHKNFPSREEFDAAVDAALREARIELLCNAGFMRLHTPGFVEGW
ncbi:MAG: formyltransferase family protein, partial [Methyloceanibacter sp.]